MNQRMHCTKATLPAFPASLGLAAIYELEAKRQREAVPVLHAIVVEVAALLPALFVVRVDNIRWALRQNGVGRKDAFRTGWKQKLRLQILRNHHGTPQLDPPVAPAAASGSDIDDRLISWTLRQEISPRGHVLEGPVGPREPRAVVRMGLDRQHFGISSSDRDPDKRCQAVTKVKMRKFRTQDHRHACVAFHRGWQFMERRAVGASRSKLRLLIANDEAANPSAQGRARSARHGGWLTIVWRWDRRLLVAS